MIEINIAHTADKKPNVGINLSSNINIENSPANILDIHPHFVAFFQYNAAIVVGHRTASPEKVVFTSVDIIPTFGS